MLSTYSWKGLLEFQSFQNKFKRLKISFKIFVCTNPKLLNKISCAYPQWTNTYQRYIILCRWLCLNFVLAQQPPGARASSFTRFLHHTQRRIIVGRTPLEEWLTRRIDLYLTTHNTHNRQTSMPLVGFEPKISTGERPQTYALDRGAIGTGCLNVCLWEKFCTSGFRADFPERS